MAATMLGSEAAGAGVGPGSRVKLLQRYGRARVLRAAVEVRGEPVGGDESLLSVLGDARVVRRLRGEMAGAEGFALVLEEDRDRKGAGGGNVMHRANARVFLCAWPPADHPQSRELTVATSDRCDRAHDVRVGGAGGLLISAAQLNSEAKPRRYPPCQVNVRRLAVDSQFDELFERQRRLDRDVGGVAGVSYAQGGRESGGSASGVALKQAVWRIGDEEVYKRLRRNSGAWGSADVSQEEIASWSAGGGA
jgi:hypothetical protein